MGVGHRCSSQRISYLHKPKSNYWSTKLLNRLTSLPNIFDKSSDFHAQFNAQVRSKLIIYSSHSRKKVKALYPEINAADVRSLYQTKNKRHEKLERLDIPKFLLDTASVIKVLVCQIGKLGSDRHVVIYLHLIQSLQRLTAQNCGSQLSRRSGCACS